MGVRQGKRKSGLSQKAVYAIIKGQPVRRSTLESFKRAIEERKRASNDQMVKLIRAPKARPNRRK